MILTVGLACSYREVYHQVVSDLRTVGLCKPEDQRWSVWVWIVNLGRFTTISNVWKDLTCYCERSGVVRFRMTMLRGLAGGQLEVNEVKHAVVNLGAARPYSGDKVC